jgi:hypothetical protein
MFTLLLILLFTGSISKDFSLINGVCRFRGSITCFQEFVIMEDYTLNLIDRLVGNRRLMLSTMQSKSEPMLLTIRFTRIGAISVL